MTEEYYQSLQAEFKDFVDTCCESYPIFRNWSSFMTWADGIEQKIAQLTAERDAWRADAEQLAKHHLSITKANLFHCSYCGYITTDDDGILVHQDTCPITLHRELVEKYKKEVVR